MFGATNYDTLSELLGRRGNWDARGKERNHGGIGAVGRT